MDEAELFHYWNKRLKEEGARGMLEGEGNSFTDLVESHPAYLRRVRKIWSCLLRFPVLASEK